MSDKELNLKLETLDCQWVVEELDRVWFHDNALAFRFMEWVGSLCSRSDVKRPSSGGKLGELPRVRSEMELSRTLRETGKVYSTGDLPKARLVASLKRALEDDQSSEATNGAMSPGCVSEGGAEEYEPYEIIARKLETIPSASMLVPLDAPTGGAATVEDVTSTPTPTSTLTPPPLPRRRRRKQRRKHTSLSELEFDELRGFRDLGFKLTKEEVAPRVVSLVPPHGFDRSKTSHASSDKKRDVNNKSPYRERIYPSHAWSIRRPDSPLLNLRMPDPSSEVDMKAHLKFWARTVASTVRQEC